MKRAWMLVAISMAVATVGWAQKSDYGVRCQDVVALPSEVTGLSIVDGDLLCNVGGLMMKAQRVGGNIVGFWPDTVLQHVESEVEYQVVHPTTGSIYFTKRDKRGESQLYVYERPEGKKSKVRRVKMNGMPVEHPTFSTDGNVMVFVSYGGKSSIGMKDLWYSKLKEGEWEKPRNMGKRVNSKYDDVSPMIYGEYLIFASNGREQDHMRTDLYVTRLIADMSEGDTVGVGMIGVQPVQRLPYPINRAESDEAEMVVDKERGCCYWVSDRQEGQSKIFVMEGMPDGVVLWGRTIDRNDNPVDGVEATVRCGDETICTTKSNASGFYTIFLQQGKSYTIDYRKDGFYVAHHAASPKTGGDENMLGDMKMDVKMDGLAIGQTLQYYDIFDVGASVEMGEMGEAVLAPLVRYLKDNPTMSIEATLYSDVTTSARFNQMLTADRIKTLEAYLRKMLPGTVAMKFKNGCGGVDGCETASGISRLAVVISAQKKQQNVHR